MWYTLDFPMCMGRGGTIKKHFIGGSYERKCPLAKKMVYLDLPTVHDIIAPIVVLRPRDLLRLETLRVLSLYP